MTETTLDFLYRLKDAVNSLNLEFPLIIGQLSTSDSISLHALPGGRNIEFCYDGTKDKQLSYEFSIKTKNQEKAMNDLTVISEFLEDLTELSSENDSYLFDSIIISNEPFFVGRDEQGFFFYSLNLQALINVK
ncbi:capsid protein [Listeria monocytogenes serotype 1/2b]|uniref:phage tail terminator protein n=1 Tax=Listeria seeligeri TaxID=1640 RepID=UPI001887E488|nr:minor capsid protein [Listeria seeligeri]EHC6275904.1 capsid protein [Listeria monocytogenes serotype 1/2b]MBF2440343.1 capsid protein [Listeria seeligeri]